MARAGSIGSPDTLATIPRLSGLRGARVGFPCTHWRKSAAFGDWRFERNVPVSKFARPGKLLRRGRAH